MSEPLPCGVPEDAPGISEGDVFTIKGIKVLPNGRFITDCAPGEETRLRAVYPKRKLI